VRLDDFDYELPEELVARAPSEERDLARLLVHDVESGETDHARIRDLPDRLRPDDLLVLNDTRVRPARLFGHRRSGGAVELLLLDRRAGLWRARINPARKLHPDERVKIDGGGAAVALERPVLDGGEPDTAWTIRLEPPAGEDEDAWLERVGRMPLPPYIARARGVDAKKPGSEADDALDRERYQTVFAREPGAVAAPTAGLHFTPELLRRLGETGVELAWVTLHVGEGTFQPVKVEDVREHEMHAERFELPEATVEAVERCRRRGGRVIAVGTTSVRVLESRFAGGRLVPGSGETSLFILPGRRFGVVDGLLTNFHLPKSTLLMLVAAFAGRERVLALYREAIEHGYRFYSYGDAMLLFAAPRVPSERGS
jgi:S-adenosylmethionine:tRNA ribosyltransferase-isomerase